MHVLWQAIEKGYEELDCMKKFSAYTRAHIRYTRAYTHIHVHAHTRTRAYTYTHTHIVRAMIVAMINGNALECPCTGG